MKRLLICIACTVAVTASARAQFLNEAWTEPGEVVTTGNFVQDPGLELLMRYAPTNRLTVMDEEGVYYELPSLYSQYTRLEILVRDFDMDGLDELCLFIRTPSLDDRVALFNLWPEPGPRWEICCAYVYDSLRTVNLTGVGIEILVHWGQSFTVLESWTGNTVFNWHEAYPSLDVLGTQVLDMDGDGREEALVQAESRFDYERSAYVLDYGGPAAVGDDPSRIEARPLAARNAPNPFRGPTEIEFSLPARDQVVVRVYDPAGRLVRTLMDETREAGTHLVTWDGVDDAGQAARSGAYFCEVTSGGERVARKMIRIR